MPGSRKSIVGHFRGVGFEPASLSSVSRADKLVSPSPLAGRVGLLADPAGEQCFRLLDAEAVSGLAVENPTGGAAFLGNPEASGGRLNPDAVKGLAARRARLFGGFGSLGSLSNGLEED